MNYLELDFTAPIALLGCAIVGVMIVRLLVGRGEARAKERTRRILERHRLRGEDRSAP